ncbi:hypothetical protein SLA2020_382030 [Shorea laevis]
MLLLALVWLQNGGKKSLLSQVMVNQGMELGITDAKKDEILVRAFLEVEGCIKYVCICQYLRISIGEDVKYEGVYEWKGRTYNANDLHAGSLTFKHPVTGFQIMIKEPLPPCASQALQPIIE